MWKILQNNKADDFVIATGQQYSVKEFVNLVLKELKLDLNGKVMVLTQNVMIIREMYC